jgi:nitroreductase
VRTPSGERPSRVTHGEIEQAIALGLRAPSLHNTQPWHWRVTDGGFELFADESRQLPVTDPDQHGLLISCGAALELARLGLAARGWATEVDRLPDPGQSTLLARVRATTWSEPDRATDERAAAAWRRRTERRPFRAEPVSDTLIDAIVERGTGEGAYLHAIRREAELLGLEVVTSHANADEIRDPGYRRELATWTGAEGRDDGVPPTAVPHLAAGEERQSDIELRDFELGTEGRQPLGKVGVEHPAVLALLTESDDRASWLRAGEALGRVLVEAERLGLAAAPFTQPVDRPGWRSRLRVLMGWLDHPQFLLRVGWPPTDGTSSVTPRRDLPQVLDE